MSRTMEVEAEGEPGGIAKNEEKKDTGGGTNNIVRVFGENVAGQRPATFSQKHGLCPFRVFRCLGCLGVMV